MEQDKLGETLKRVLELIHEMKEKKMIVPLGQGDIRVTALLVGWSIALHGLEGRRLPGGMPCNN